MDLKGLTEAFYGSEKVKKYFLVLWFIDTAAFTAITRDEVFLTGHMKGISQ